MCWKEAKNVQKVLLLKYDILRSKTRAKFWYNLQKLYTIFSREVYFRLLKHFYILNWFLKDKLQKSSKIYHIFVVSVSQMQLAIYCSYALLLIIGWKLKIIAYIILVVVHLCSSVGLKKVLQLNCIRITGISSHLQVEIICVEIQS